jgi:APA family basic amino acid/polyamine antiporter
MDSNTATQIQTKQGLTLLDSTMLIMGSMIGSGIFLVSAGIAQEVQTPGMLLLVWVVTGVITVFGALSYGELAAMMPKAGGQYIYLKEAYNPLAAFLYGWSLFTVIQTGTIAAVGVAFARFTGVFIPWFSDANILLQLGWFKFSSNQLLGILCIALLTALNFRAVKSGALVQNILTITKVGALVAMILLGLWAGVRGVGSVSHFSLPQTWPDGIGLATVGVFFAAMVGSLFSSDAWNNVTFTAGEVLNPKRNLPLSLAIATIGVSLIYVAINATYLLVLPIDRIAHAENSRVATAVMNEVLGGTGVYVIAAMIMVSTFGCLNGVILSGARVYYAMAQDGLFFKQAAQLNKNAVPANSLAFQGAWSIVLTLSGSYNDLLEFVMFAVILFYILTVIGLFILRRTRPDAPRPYKVVGYPVVPAVYILLAGTFCITVIIYKPVYSLAGLGLILLGMPIYYWLERRKRAA